MCIYDDIMIRCFDETNEAGNSRARELVVRPARLRYKKIVGVVRATPQTPTSVSPHVNMIVSFIRAADGDKSAPLCFC